VKSHRTRASRTIDAAEKVASILATLGIDSAVIGAMALASHKYVRNTSDFDLATCADVLVQLPAAKEALEKEEFDAELRLPDAEDPLGGVLRLTRRGIRRIEIVNYLNPFVQGAALLAQEAIRTATPARKGPGSLRVVDLSHLIALKLYAGGPRSRSDVVELLERNAPLDLASIRDTCARHGLEAHLKAILEELRLG
jgi:hypothetical protein